MLGGTPGCPPRRAEEPCPLCLPGSQPETLLRSPGIKLIPLHHKQGTLEKPLCSRAETHVQKCCPRPGSCPRDTPGARQEPSPPSGHALPALHDSSRHHQSLQTPQQATNILDTSLDLGQAQLNRLQGTQPAVKGRVSSTLQLSEVTSTSTTRAGGLAVFSQESLGEQVGNHDRPWVVCETRRWALRSQVPFLLYSDPWRGKRALGPLWTWGGHCAQPNSMAKMLSHPCSTPTLQMDKARLREGQAHVQSCGDQGPAVIPTEGCVVPLSI